MIPAILSCLFVIYLYRTLNEQDAPEASSSTLQSLDAKVDDLQRRLDQLLKAQRSSGR